MEMTLPNILTWLRILMIPVLGLLFLLPTPWANAAAAIVFALASITDWLDGFLARRWNQVSPFGAFLDPVADKLIVAIALIIVLVESPTALVAIPVAIIIGREIAVSALREWMAELGQRASVAVGMTGKFKTAAQMIAIILLLYRHELYGIPTWPVGLGMLYVAAGLTLYSMVLYLSAALKTLDKVEQG
ncbi:CDP-diacylglycerol--glycerol-3-phosphate 3-phosphatidyltransferase [Spiribacter vilamensis]|uniref:CDP-diacylglycerol--glycerol-3-phosphate 3-phosphatidyltransferase n=1 Tax=Spiribacter vilamensis TaxID=531306 RepID=A0A4Q8D030_9GAMM|nr:CDP-diacylglycerol--glycerol-3-phosphate 3-phosphatidyltransferase [Spiribacter vilamensis]RZU98567.1 CDP-diacylglycerol--glycerol-3-phosphate 3-phosphatidyltransferase [Spiribacter vilamensis]TVO60173.1 CDP-diacylglycerol--glycerol-3-phosphate 3-phosphatidyltransferase [Spiribacter vilamensis]